MVLVAALTGSLVNSALAEDDPLAAQSLEQVESQRAIAIESVTTIRSAIAALRTRPEAEWDPSELDRVARAIWNIWSRNPREFQPERSELRDWLVFAAEANRILGNHWIATSFRYNAAGVARDQGLLDVAADIQRSIAFDCSPEVWTLRLRSLLDMSETEMQRGNWIAALELASGVTHEFASSKDDAILQAELSRASGVLSALHRELGTAEQARIFQRRQAEAAKRSGNALAIIQAEIEGIRIDLAGSNIVRVPQRIATLLEDPRVNADPTTTKDLRFLELLARGRSLEFSNEFDSRTIENEFLDLANHRGETLAMRLRSAWWVAALATRRQDRDAVAHAIELAGVRFSDSPVHGDLGQLRALLLGRAAELAEAEAPSAIISTPPALERYQVLANQFDLLLEEWKRRPQLESGVGLLRFTGRRQVVFDMMRTAIATFPGESGKQRAVDSWLATQGIGSLSQDRALERPTLSLIRNRVLRPSEGMLAFLPAETGTLILAIDSDSITIAQAPGEYALSATRIAFERMMETRPTRKANEVTASDRAIANRECSDLGRLLLPRAITEKFAHWDGVVVIGADMLFCPFIEALLGEGQQEPLGVRLAVRHLPSVAFGGWLAQAKTRADVGRELALFVNPRPDSRVANTFRVTDDLVLESRTRTGLTRSFAGTTPWFISGSDATVTTLRTIDPRRFGTVCVIAHGIRNRELARPAGLLLAPNSTSDGTLFAPDIEQIPSPATVLLAVCGSASGPYRFGDEGVQHLVGAFFRAGAHSIAASSLELDYEATLEVLLVALPELAKGKSLAQSLQQARRVIRENPRFDHPSLYLTLQAFGN